MSSLSTRAGAGPKNWTRQSSLLGLLHKREPPGMMPGPNMKTGLDAEPFDAGPSNLVQCRFGIELRFRGNFDTSNKDNI